MALDMFEKCLPCSAIRRLAYETLQGVRGQKPTAFRRVFAVAMQVQPWDKFFDIATVPDTGKRTARRRERVSTQSGAARKDEEQLRSGKFMLAANAQIFLRLHQRHSEQMGNQIQVVTSRKPDQRRQGLGNIGHGFVRTVVANQFVGLRSPVPIERAAHHFTRGSFQKNASESARLR
jgi:hypothetical protein